MTEEETSNFCIYSLFILQRKPPMAVENLFEDMKDGVKLLALLEVLSGQKLVRIQTRRIVSIWNWWLWSWESKGL